MLVRSSRTAISPSGCKASSHKAKAARHCEQCSRCQNDISQYMTDLQMPMQGTAAEFWQQKLAANPQSAIPLIAQDVTSAAASQAFVERLFSVCGLLTAVTRNRMEKSFRTCAHGSKSTVMYYKTSCRVDGLDLIKWS